MAKSHCMSRHAARECSRGCAKKNGDWARRDDQAAADVVKGKAFPFLSMTYFWNVSCLVVRVGLGKLTLVWCVELTSQTADEEVIFSSLSRLFKHTRSTGRLGTTATFLLSPKPKNICHSWEQLAWLLWQAEVAPKRAAKASFGIGNGSHIHADFVVHRTPLKWKSFALSNHTQLAQLVYVK